MRIAYRKENKFFIKEFTNVYISKTYCDGPILVAQNENETQEFDLSRMSDDFINTIKNNLLKLGYINLC